MHQFQVTPQQTQQFQQDGYFIVEQLLDDREVRLLRDIARADLSLQTERSSRADGEGGAVDLVVRNDLPEDTIYGAIVRSRRIAGPRLHDAAAQPFH